MKSSSEITVKPAYEDQFLTLYHGDCREVIPTLDGCFDLVLADPPYGETCLSWDKRVEGWESVCAKASSDNAGLWLWGSLDSLCETRSAMVEHWRRARGVEIIWRKSASRRRLARISRPNSGDRPSRTHEMAAFFYRGGWHLVHHDCPRVEVSSDHSDGSVVNRQCMPGSHTSYANDGGQYVYDNSRFLESVVDVPLDPRGTNIHPTQKPVALVKRLIEYGCPEGGTVLVPFVGSGSDLLAARALGRRAVGCEADGNQVEKTVERLSGQLDLLMAAS